MTAAVAPPSIMTVEGEVRSMMTPPTRAPVDSVAWNEAVKRTDAASGACGAALANQVCEQTGTAP